MSTHMPGFQSFSMQHESLHVSFVYFRGINPTRWSSCSRDYLADTFHLGMDYCLKEKPQQLFDSPTCGNGFVEEGEECDCGLPEVSRLHLFFPNFIIQI